MELKTSDHGLILPDGSLWPYCEVPGCEFCVCTWATDSLCYVHSLEKIGEGGMKEAYEKTHDISWEEFLMDI